MKRTVLMTRPTGSYCVCVPGDSIAVRCEEGPAVVVINGLGKGAVWVGGLQGITLGVVDEAVGVAELVDGSIRRRRPGKPLTSAVGLGRVGQHAPEPGRAALLLLHALVSMLSGGQHW